MKKASVLARETWQTVESFTRTGLETGLERQNRLRKAKQHIKNSVLNMLKFEMAIRHAFEYKKQVTVVAS